MMIERQDWEKAEKAFKELTTNAENQIVNSQINIELYNHLIPFIKGKIKEFPEEKKEADPMPEGIKKIVNEVKNA